MERKCALCLEYAELHRSHIIPEFLYRTLYDEQHRFHVLSTQMDQTETKRQKGLWEWLLCATCEQKFSVWERYVSLLLNGGVPIAVSRERSIAVVTGVDYKKFKLFQLSVLWRSGIARGEFFSKVRLGDHQEKIREMLVKNDPGPASAYGSFMFGLKGSDGPTTGLMMQPVSLRVEGQICYHFIFGGIAWIYFVSRKIPSPVACAAFAQPSGQIILSIKDVYATEWIQKFAGKIHRLGRI
jgi:hypothetical protein